MRIRGFGIREPTFRLGSGTESDSITAMDGAGTTGDAIGTTTGWNMTTTGTPLEAELSTIAIIIIAAAATGIGTHSAIRETKAPLEVTANAEARTAARGHQLGRSREIRVLLAATAKHVVKATRALEGSVITTMAERRDVTRQEGGPASVVEDLTAAAVVFTVMAVVSTPVVVAIASKSERRYCGPKDLKGTR